MLFAISNCLLQQSYYRRTLRLSQGANLDVTQSPSGSFEEMRRVLEHGAVVKAEVYIRTLNPDIRVMVSHLFGTHTETGDLLPGPHHLEKVLVQSQDRFPQRLAKGPKPRPRGAKNVVKTSVCFIYWHMFFGQRPKFSAPAHGTQQLQS